MVLLTFLGFLLACYIGAVIFLERRRKYWIRKGVPSVEMQIPFISKPPPGPARPQFLIIQDDYKINKKLGHKHFGSCRMLRPTYHPIDPELIKHVLAKDFPHFMDRGVYYNEKHDPISAQLFNLEGQRWRNLRAKLTPTFTSGKMKMMFQTLVDCGVPMVGKVEELREKKEPIDIKEILACFTTDVIGSCAFGLECNSFKSEKSAFREAGKNFFGMNKWRKIRLMAIMTVPEICHVLGVPMFEKSLTNFYFDVVENTLKYREDNTIKRNDFMDLLVEMKKKGELTIGEIAAQGLLFFLAGFETSSTLMYFCITELTENPDIQEKLREEMLATLKKHDGKITYDSVMEMKYLGLVLDETLRKYPPVPFIIRKCVQDYQVPGTDIVIEAGTKVDIPAYAIHHDPEYYPDPDKFDPQRFTEENKANRHPYVYMPFGEGPRICIGLRFGLMQARVGLTLLLTKYRFTMNPKTVTPLGFSPTAFLMSSLNKLYLDLEAV